jgi:hypothetical protein
LTRVRIAQHEGDLVDGEPVLAEEASRELATEIVDDSLEARSVLRQAPLERPCAVPDASSGPLETGGTVGESRPHRAAHPVGDRLVAA